MEHKACCFHGEVNKKTTAASGMALQDLDLYPTGVSVQQFYNQYCMAENTHSALHCLDTLIFSH